ncbi:MAG: helix-turn-helix transcriptional regulator [Hyphomicrobiales bacterium]|nr:helix-turn-helix transcriptional regulator [Hyphomicrobiales bacterium]
MKEFTTAALTALLASVLEDFDPSLLSGIKKPDPMSKAIVPDTAKRTLAERVLERHGPGPLLAVGQYLHKADENPILTVLTASPDPNVLAEKWMRLERYLHSTHRVEISAADDKGWMCERLSISGPPPTFAENCLIAGLLLGLITEIGVTDPRLDIGDQSVPGPDLLSVQLPADEQLLGFGLHWIADQPRSQDTSVDDTQRPVRDRLTDLLAADIGRSWRLQDAARSLAYSERSLQRRLSEEERSFSSVLRRARMREATDLLTVGSASLAEVGYCCGYADQAHFQRDFLRTTNMTPKTFREINQSANSGVILQ